MRLLTVTMRFAELVREKETQFPAWSRRLYASVVMSGTEGATDANVEHAEKYAEILAMVLEFEARIQADLTALRRSWSDPDQAAGPGAPAGVKRLAVFDRCVVSWAVRVLPPTPEELAREPRTCEFTGMPTCDWVVMEFGHQPTDRAVPLRALLDRTAFDELVRPIMLYAHFFTHMVQHMDTSYTQAERLLAYSRELDEVRRVVRAMNLRR